MYGYRQVQQTHLLDRAWPTWRVQWLKKNISQTSFLLFHVHEITPRLFHLVLEDPSHRLPFWNCFYDVSTHVFFFDQNKLWIRAMEQTTWWKELVFIDCTSCTQTLYTPEDIIKLVKKEKRPH